MLKIRTIAALAAAVLACALSTAAWAQVPIVGRPSGAAVASLAPLNSPALIGNPTAPTQPTADASTDLATDAFVKAQGYALASALASYAPLASAALTGSPTAPDYGSSPATYSAIATRQYLISNYVPLNSAGAAVATGIIGSGTGVSISGNGGTISLAGALTAPSSVSSVSITGLTSTQSDGSFLVQPTVTLGAPPGGTAPTLVPAFTAKTVMLSPSASAAESYSGSDGSGFNTPGVKLSGAFAASNITCVTNPVLYLGGGTGQGASGNPPVSGAIAATNGVVIGSGQMSSCSYVGSPTGTLNTAGGVDVTVTWSTGNGAKGIVYFTWAMLANLGVSGTATAPYLTAPPVTVTGGTAPPEGFTVTLAGGPVTLAAHPPAYTAGNAYDITDEQFVENSIGACPNYSTEPSSPGPGQCVYNTGADRYEFYSPVAPTSIFTPATGWRLFIPESGGIDPLDLTAAASLALPNLTATAEAALTPVQSMVDYNTTNRVFDFYEGSGASAGWVNFLPISGGASNATTGTVYFGAPAALYNGKALDWQDTQSPTQSAMAALLNSSGTWSLGSGNGYTYSGTAVNRTILSTKATDDTTVLTVGDSNSGVSLSGTVSLPAQTASTCVLGTNGSNTVVPTALNGATCSAGSGSSPPTLTFTGGAVSCAGVMSGGYQPGVFYPPLGLTTSTGGIPVASRAYALPFCNPTTVTIKTLSFDITTAYTTAAWNVYMGLYSSTASNYPGTLLVGTGEIAIPSTQAAGVVTSPTLNGTGYSLAPGWYWEVFLSDTAGPTVEITASGINLMSEATLGQTSAASAFAAGGQRQAAYQNVTFGALSSSLATWSTTQNWIASGAPFVVAGF